MRGFGRRNFDGKRFNRTVRLKAAQNRELLFDVILPEDFQIVLVRVFEMLPKEPDSKVYFIYYEGGQYPSYKKTVKGFNQKMLNPARGDALNRTKALFLYLTKYRKVPQEKIVLIDGGYMENYEVETWIVPKDAKPPEPTPNLTEKDIKFRKGKPFQVPDCEGSYRNYP